MISNKPIKEHIQYFLDYCEIEKGLRDNTQENYKKYLEKFFFWLDQTKNSSILPHQLTSDHIWGYRIFLSRQPSRATGKLLSKGTQNYYLIALRAFLGYFVAKDILSLPPDKISLPKPDKSQKTVKFLSLDQIGKLLNAPRGKTKKALRDRAILHTIISTGLKVRQIANLNIEDTKDLPENLEFFINEYLKIRDDKDRSLFINHSGYGDHSRLTPRSIERIVKSYGELLDIDFSITPELLRSANILSMWNKKININDKSWADAENEIVKNIIWLKEDVSVMPERYRNDSPLKNLIKCDDCLLRRIATLIVSGDVKAEKILLKDFWPKFYFDESDRRLHNHGADWHRKMIDSVAQYIGRENVIIEPILNYGRADIGIIDKATYIEIGTVSLLKIWYNLMAMPSSIFILIPDGDFIIKLKN